MEWALYYDRRLDARMEKAWPGYGRAGLATHWGGRPGEWGDSSIMAFQTCLSSFLAGRIPTHVWFQKGKEKGLGPIAELIAASPRSPLLEEYNKIKPFSLGFSIMPMDKMTIHFQMHEKLTRCQPGVPSARKASLRRGLGGGWGGHQHNRKATSNPTAGCAAPRVPVHAGDHPASISLVQKSFTEDSRQVIYPLTWRWLLSNRICTLALYQWQFLPAPEDSRVSICSRGLGGREVERIQQH